MAPAFRLQKGVERPFQTKAFGWPWVRRLATINGWIELRIAEGLADQKASVDLMTKGKERDRSGANPPLLWS
jgi:hypothetical protein